MFENMFEKALKEFNLIFTTAHPFKWNKSIIIIGSSIPIYTWLHFIHITL